MERRIVRHATRMVQQAALEVTFRPGQRVRTIDGMIGRVLLVSESFSPGIEQYQVVLDDGMGGGTYQASQLRPVPEGYGGLHQAPAHLPAGVHHSRLTETEWHHPVTADEARLAWHNSPEAQAGMSIEAYIRLASDDYPEMGSVLHEHPDPARQITVIGSRHEAIALPNSQLKLFHMEHEPRPACPECGFHPGDRDEYGSFSHTKHMQQAQGVYEPEPCDHCGGDLKDREEHEEEHRDWLGEQDWHTDWSEEHPGDTLHRGIAMRLPEELHEHVHDESRPVHERAHALISHVLRDQSEGSYHGGLGNYWSDDPDVSKTYAQTTTAGHYGRTGLARDQTPVMIHAHFPGMEHVETDPDTLQHWGVFSYHRAGNREVPIQNQAPLRIKGISWATPGHGLGEGKYVSGPVTKEHLHEDPAWTHHEFEGEGIRAHAAQYGTDEDPREPGDSGGIYWQAPAQQQWIGENLDEPEEPPPVPEEPAGEPPEPPADDEEREETEPAGDGSEPQEGGPPWAATDDEDEEEPGEEDEDLPPHEAAWRWAEAMGARGDLPGEMMLQYGRNAIGNHWVSAVHGGHEIGSMHWGDHGVSMGPGSSGHAPGIVTHLEVDPDYQRHGVATAMWEHAHRMSPDDPPVHSWDQSPDGEAWAQAVGGRTYAEGSLHEATTINQVRIDDHGDAPDHGTIPRAANAESYDQRSTEGQGDSKWSEVLPESAMEGHFLDPDDLGDKHAAWTGPDEPPGVRARDPGTYDESDDLDDEDRERVRNGAAIGMYPEGISGGGGPGLSIGGFTAALSPEEHERLKAHMQETHKWPYPDFQTPAQLGELHENDHMAIGQGIEGLEPHFHGQDYDYQQGRWESGSDASGFHEFTAAITGDEFHEYGNSLAERDHLHRGIHIELDPDVHEYVHDQAAPVADRAEVLLNNASRRGLPGLGQHWTPHLQIAHRAISNASSGDDAWEHEWDEDPDEWSGQFEKGAPKTDVILHAHTPGRRNEVRDPKVREQHGVGWRYSPDEHEMFLREGTPLRIAGISWREHEPEYPNASYEHHDFGRSMRHIARVPWTGHERTELHDWSTGAGANPGDFVPSSRYHQPMLPVLPPEIPPEEEEAVLSKEAVSMLQAEAFQRRRADAVYAQLAEDYPAKALDWIHQVRWHGPQTTDLSDIDWDARESWHAYNQPDDVAKARKKAGKKLARGERPKPAILTQASGLPRRRIADGHHRGIGALLDGRPLDNYTADVPDEKGPWAEMHASQFRGPGTKTIEGPEGTPEEREAFHQEIEGKLATLPGPEDPEDGSLEDGEQAPQAETEDEANSLDSGDPGEFGKGMPPVMTGLPPWTQGTNPPPGQAPGKPSRNFAPPGEDGKPDFLKGKDKKKADAPGFSGDKNDTPGKKKPPVRKKGHSEAWLRHHVLHDHGWPGDVASGHPAEDLAWEHSQTHRFDTQSGEKGILHTHGPGWEPVPFTEDDRAAEWGAGRSGYHDFIAGRKPELARAMQRAAAASPAFGFEFTASWRDVVAKAKRIRRAMGVRITHVSAGMVIGEVRGDHDVYESGIQRVAGKPRSIMHWACGCPWASFHQDKTVGTRYAGRPCSHVYALQLEATSRTMHGRELREDQSLQNLGLTPGQVVVKSLPPWGPGGWNQVWLAPQASRTAAWEPSYGYAKQPYMRPVKPGELEQHLIHHHDIDPEMIQRTGIPRLNSFHDFEHRRQGTRLGDPDLGHQHEEPGGAPGESRWPDLYRIPPRTMADINGGMPFGERDDLGETEEYHPGPYQHLSYLVTADQANAPWSGGAEEAHPPAKPYGATRPRDKNENPASAGFLTLPDPENWSEIDDSSYIQQPLSNVAALLDEMYPPPSHCMNCGMRMHLPSEPGGMGHWPSKIPYLCNDCYIGHVGMESEFGKKPSLDVEDKGGYGSRENTNRLIDMINEGNTPRPWTADDALRSSVSMKLEGPDMGDWIPERQEGFPYSDQANAAGPSTSSEPRDPQGIRMEEMRREAERSIRNHVMAQHPELQQDVSAAWDRLADRGVKFLHDQAHVRGPLVHEHQHAYGEFPGEVSRPVPGFSLHYVSQAHEQELRAHMRRDHYLPTRNIPDYEGVTEWHEQDHNLAGPHYHEEYAGPVGSAVSMDSATYRPHSGPIDPIFGAKRHSWEGDEVNRDKTCRNCGLRARRYGHGAASYWMWKTPEGEYEAGARSTPPCGPEAHEFLYPGRSPETGEDVFKRFGAAMRAAMAELTDEQPQLMGGLGAELKDEPEGALDPGGVTADDVDQSGPSAGSAASLGSWGASLQDDEDRPPLTYTSPGARLLQQHAQDHPENIVWPERPDEYSPGLRPPYIAPARSRPELIDHMRGEHGITFRGDRDPANGFLIRLHNQFHDGTQPDRRERDHQHEVSGHDPVFGAMLPDHPSDTSGQDPLGAATTGGGPGMSMHDEDGMGWDEPSIQTVGTQQWSGGGADSDELAVPAGQPQGDEYGGTSGTGQKEDEVVRLFQASAGGQALVKTAEVFGDEEARQLIAEGRGQRARNLDLLDIHGTHYEDNAEEMRRRGLSLDHYDDDLVLM